MIKCGSIYTFEGTDALRKLRHTGRRLGISRDQSNDVPLVTIATICRNNQSSLRRCIESVIDQVSETPHNQVEYIMWDGESTDSCWDIICEYQGQIEYAVSGKDRGIYDALNKALELSRGRYICFIHGDDFLSHGALLDAIHYLEAGKADIHCGSAVYYDECNRYAAYKPSRLYGAETIFKGITAPHESTFISSHAYTQTGGYDLNYKIAADYKLIRDIILFGASQTRSDRVYSAKLAGGSSFDDGAVDNEQIRLLSELFPRQNCNSLYQATADLKSNRNMTKESIASLYYLLQTESCLPEALLHSLALSLCREILGDTNTSTVIPVVNPPLPSADLGKNMPKIMLCAWKLHEVSGGAEKVLIQVSNHLASLGYRVVISTADYLVGKPFYPLSGNVELLTHGEYRLKNTLDSTRYIGYFQNSIHEIIDRLPKDVLYAAHLDSNSRSSYLKWEDIDQKQLKESISNKQALSDDLKQESEMWLKLYGNNAAIWRKQIEIHKPDIVVPFMISSIPQVALACRGLKVRLHTSNHNNPKLDYFQRDDWCHLSLDRALRFYGILSGWNHWLLPEYLHSLPPSCRNNSVVIGNPIVPVSSKVRSQWSGSNRFIAVGRLTDAKDFKFLISSYKVYRNRGGTKSLSIFGSGPLQNILNEQIQKDRLSDCVDINQPVRDISSEYMKSSIFLSTSVVEGFPLTLCEAMQHGLPCIGRGLCSGVNSLISHGKTGLLTPLQSEAEELNSYASLMLMTETDVSLREQIRSDALLALAEFAPERVLKQWEDFVNRRAHQPG